MLESMTTLELNYWLVLESIDPVGPRRSDLQHAVTATTLYNLQVDRKDRVKDFAKFNAGEILQEAYRESAKRRGVVSDEWNAQAWWSNIDKFVVKE